jgi:hypothetical protein
MKRILVALLFLNGCIVTKQNTEPVGKILSIERATSTTSNNPVAIIKGKVVEVNRPEEEIAMAQVVISSLDSVFRKAVYSDTLGYFQIDNVPSGNYFFRVACVGCNQAFVSDTIFLGAGEKVNIVIGMLRDWPNLSD